jgi:NADH:ubiquinone oxidoreductase subunit 6 (subunit J)
MKAEKQIKIARGTAFALSFVILLAPPLFVADKINKGESVTWQFALLFMGLMYILMSPLFALCLVYAWSLKRRKQKTAIVFFSLHVIWSIGTVITNSLLLPIEIAVVALLLQGILGLRKLQAVSSSPVPD